VDARRKRRSFGYGDIEWPRQYRTAKVQLERNLQREKEAAAANAGLTPQEIAAKLLGS
jgi:anthraniloyl-CoA monooxygenase